jgi:predicted phosphate transport protein (TIGR00153 family)
MSRKWLQRWFGDRRNEKVLEMVREHLELTQDAVEELYNMVCSACESEIEKEALYKKISDVEMKADQLRRDMVHELTERDIFPTEREDLMELVRAVDWVADWAREAGRILTIIPFDKAPEKMKIAAENMCKSNNDCVTVLAKCINMLQSDPKESINLANQVEMLEEDIDELYSVARRHLATLEFPDFTLGSLILLNEFLDSIETVADWCENTADIVRAVAVRLG